MMRMSKMNKTIMTGLAAAVALLGTGVMTSCGSEDALEADYINPSDYFKPAAGDDSQESQLRNDFFEQYGSYLLFNDTIQNVYLGTDINGDDRYFVETVDLTYTVGQTGFGKTGTYYIFTYLNSWEQKQYMVDYMKTYILPHFSKRFRPDSWLLTDVITGKLSRRADAQTNTPYAVVGQRCTAIAGNYLIQRQRTEAQIQNYTNRILNIIVGQLVKNYADAFSDFYAVSSAYYNQSATNLGYPSNAAMNSQDLYKFGFLIKGTNAMIVCDRDTDLSAYASSAIENSEEQIEKLYSGYDLVLRKHRIIREILTELGYIF